MTDLHYFPGTQENRPISLQVEFPSTDQSERCIQLVCLYLGGIMINMYLKNYVAWGGMV